MYLAKSKKIKQNWISPEKFFLPYFWQLVTKPYLCRGVWMRKFDQTNFCIFSIFTNFLKQTAPSNAGRRFSDSNLFLNKKSFNFSLKEELKRVIMFRLTKGLLMISFWLIYNQILIVEIKETKYTEKKCFVS